MYKKWREVTSWYGLIVNEKKTMVSRIYADLNSQTFNLKKRCLISKPVLSFLLPTRSVPGEILSSVLSGIKSFRSDVQSWIVNVLMRYEISLRGFTLSSLPSRWVKILVRKKWFRKVVWDGPAESVEPIEGRDLPLGEVVDLPTYDRSFPTVVGSPPIASALATVTSLCALLTRAHTDAWLGVKVRPPDVKLDRSSFRLRYDQKKQLYPNTKFSGVAVRWGFLWPKELYRCVSEDYPSLLMSDRDCLIHQSVPYSSPYLVLRHSYWAQRQLRSFPPPPSLLCSQSWETPLSFLFSASGGIGW